MHKAFLLFVLVSCASSQSSPSFVGDAAKDNISYGSAKKHLVVNETTQSEVLKLFGNPDNMTFESDGEIWVYSRFKVESNSDSSSSFGNILLAGTSRKNSRTSASVKTLTILLEFNSSSVLKDYSMRTGGY